MEYGASQERDDACLDTYRYYANLRMNLLPYIYTEAKWSSETGEPLMRSMAYAYPDDLVAAGYEFQYLFGRNMLVAPGHQSQRQISGSLSSGGVCGMTSLPASAMRRRAYDRSGIG